MSDWKKYRLGDVISIAGGFAYKGNLIGQGDNYLLGMGCVSYNENFLDKGARPYEGDCPDRYSAKTGDIVLATRQQSDNLPILGMPAIIPSKYEGCRMIVGANLYKVEIKDNNFDNRYIYWLLKTPLYVNHIRSCQSGTTVRMITKANIEDFVFFAPSKIERKRIADIIWTLDDKIECNRRINENLEQQALALFKSWFVDFEPFKDQPFVESELGMIPQGLTTQYISEIPHILETGRRPKGGVGELKNGVPSIGAESVKGIGTYDYSKTKYITEDYANSLKTGKVTGYELLIYKDGGRPGYFIPNYSIFGEGYPFEECYLNEHVFKLDFNNKGYNTFCYFYFKTDYVLNYLNAQGGKAAIPGINKQDIENIMIFSPQNEKVQEFGAIILPIIKTILFNCKESRRLAELRDTLLPRLMSGELKVQDTDLINEMLEKGIR